MDEPTNFLDLDSVDSLIRAATKFPGGLITVTHNRDFLQRCSKHFLSIVPGAFLDYPDMKSAERATYSFISALEEGREVDVKKAIVQNRGGGAAHTDEDQAARRAALTAQEAAAKAKADAIEAERKAAEDAAAEKEAKRKARVAAQRTDWAENEMVFVNYKGRWQQSKVVRNVPGVGVTVEMSDGTKTMVNATKLKEEDPTPPKSSSAAGPSRGGKSHNQGPAPKSQQQQQQGSSRGGRGAQGADRGRGRGNARGGRGQQVGLVGR